MKNLLNKDTVQKLIIFAILGGIGAFIGSIIGYPIGHNNIIGVLFWDTFIGIGIGLGLFLSQNWYLKKLSTSYQNITPIILKSALAGFLGGFGLVITKIGLGNTTLIHCLAWGIESLIMAFFIAPIIPNLPKKPALIAGFLAGVLGAFFQIMLNNLGISPLISVAIGDSFKGIFIGLMLTITENIVRKAWLVIHWDTTKEEKTISLGDKPIILGSASNCHIYLPPSQGYLPMTAKIHLDKQKVFINFNHEYNPNMQKLTHELVNGEKRKLGNVIIEVKTSQ